MSRASDVSLVEEARAYESNRSFAEGAPTPARAARKLTTCPSSLPDGFDKDNKDNCDKVGCGRLCEGDGECGGLEANNCNIGGDGDWDLYYKVCKKCGYEVVDYV